MEIYSHLFPAIMQNIIIKHLFTVELGGLSTFIGNWADLYGWIKESSKDKFHISNKEKRDFIDKKLF